jgi:RNA polymerase sigma-70 factor (ECF subfamily)
MNDLNPTRGNYSAVGEAIRSAHQGNAGAFETIYHCYRGFVRRVCLGMPRDPIEVEDATQDMFRRGLLKLHTFRGESAFSTWLYRLTTNLVFMHFRKNSPEQISLGELLEDDNGPQCEVGGPDLHLNGLLDRIDLQAAVDLLPEGSKAVFVLHDVQGYGHREIARIFGYSIGNSKSQLHKARKRLRKLLGGRPSKGALQQPELGPVCQLYLPNPPSLRT